jgi:uncharacterized membrane protein YfcA
LPTEFYVFLLLGAAAGGLINGLAGFGTALFALGFWLVVMPPVQAVSMVVVISVASGMQGVWLVRRSIAKQPWRLTRFLLPALPGIPIGVAALAYIPVDTLRIIIASFMLLYGGFFTFRATLPKVERPAPIMECIVGFFGGLLGGAASLSGALPTMWCALRPWSKAETRAVLQPFNVAVLMLACIIFAAKGAYSRDTLLLIGIALPVSMIFAQIGISIFQRLDDNQFRRLIISMMFLSGLVLILSQLVA